MNDFTKRLILQVILLETCRIHLPTLSLSRFLNYKISTYICLSNSYSMTNNGDIDSYIGNCKSEVQEILTSIRKIILDAHPNIVEEWAYGMPAYRLNKKPLVYFAAFQNHIGFYATPTGHEAFAEKLSPYKQGKGSVQFPLNQPIPYNLISEIVAFRVQENLNFKK